MSRCRQRRVHPYWPSPVSMPFPVCHAERFGRTTHRTETLAPASPSNLASVSVERVSPAYPLQVRFPVPVAATPVVPYWDFHPSGSFLLLQLHVHILPLRSTVVTRFPATMGCPTPAKKNCGSPRFLDSSILTRHHQPPRRVRRLHSPAA